MRSGIQDLWRSLDITEQRRFLTHLKPYWNAVRHRLAPEAHAQLRRVLQTGSLEVRRGRISGASRPGEGVDGGRFDLVFDCSGFRPDIRSPLIRSLIAQGLAQADAHGLGLAVDWAGRVFGPNWAPSSRLFALGPLGYGSLYEITAVPEIVQQASAMAAIVATELSAFRFSEWGPSERGQRRRAV